MDPGVLAFCAVLLAAFAFGPVTAPLGLLLGLPPVLVMIGVFLGSAAFVLVSVPLVLAQVTDGLVRQVRAGMRHGPRVARWWAVSGRGSRAGAKAAALVDRWSAVLDRLGYRGVAVFAPVLGRWLIPAAAVALDAPRSSLYRWAVLSCGGWAVAGTLATDLLAGLVRG